MTLKGGALLHNRYRIQEILGQGGMGSIYRAIDENLGVEVAVKENLFTTEEYARQFHLEAVILAKLRHVNLPRVSDHFVIAEQGQYLIMDYIEGDDLRERMDRDNVVQEMDMLEISMAICDALTYMHTRKPPIVHRDIKPGNVKITKDGGIFLVDFGLAKVFLQGGQTSTGARAMTPGYSPPEQYGTARTDHRSDIYSLGATMYAALTGVIPEDSQARNMGQVTLTPVRKRNPKTTRRTANAIEKALEVHPEDRFQTATELKRELIIAKNASQPRTPDDDYVPPFSGEDVDQLVSEDPNSVQGFEAVPISGIGAAVHPLESSFPEPSAESKSAVGSAKKPRGYLLAILIVIIFGAATIWVTYLVDPSFVSRIYQEASASIVASLSRDESLQDVPMTPSITLELGTDTMVAESTIDTIGNLSTVTPQPGSGANAQSPTLTQSPTLVINPSKTLENTSSPTIAPSSTPTMVGGGSGQIAFSSTRSGLPQIWIANIDGSGLRQVTEAPSGACQPDWSPDGTRLVFISPCNDDRNTYIGSALFIIDADGTNMVSFPIQGIGNYDPDWSPDGKKIAFTALKEVERPQIWLRDLETKGLQRLSIGDLRDYQPSWSPDGSKIIFISTRQGPFQVWTMNPDGTNQERLSVSGDLKNTNPVLSPNGQLLVFTQSEGVGSIPRLKGVKFPDGAAQEFFLYTFFVYPMREADFSPDGFWIVFESWPDGESHDIYIMSASGAGLSQVTIDPSVDFDPAWRPSRP